VATLSTRFTKTLGLGLPPVADILQPYDSPMHPQKSLVDMNICINTPCVSPMRNTESNFHLQKIQQLASFENVSINDMRSKWFNRQHLLTMDIEMISNGPVYYFLF
jgi:hypothetical protein